MNDRHFILIDATLESQAPSFAQNPIFQSWLRSYDNVPDALQFISQLNSPPYSIEVYLAKDNILDDGVPSDTNGQLRALIQTFDDSETIHLVTIFCPNIDPDLEHQIRCNLRNRRLLKKVVSVINLRSYMCTEGISYFNEKISLCIHAEEEHLIPNFVQSRNDLMNELENIRKRQQPILDNLVEQHLNQPGQQPL